MRLPDNSSGGLWGKHDQGCISPEHGSVNPVYDQIILRVPTDKQARGYRLMQQMSKRM
jgi:hypothetical protein